MNSRLLITSFLILAVFFKVNTSAASISACSGDSVKAESSQIRISVSDIEEALEYEIAGEETVSGINIYPHERKKAFMLAFTETILKEKARLTLSKENGDVIFSRVVEPGKGLKPTSLGDLTEGIYMVEVKTADTTFWKKVRIVK